MDVAALAVPGTIAAVRASAAAQAPPKSSLARPRLRLRGWIGGSVMGVRPPRSGSSPRAATGGPGRGERPGSAVVTACRWREYQSVFVRTSIIFGNIAKRYRNPGSPPEPFPGVEQRPGQPVAPPRADVIRARRSHAGARISESFRIK